VRTDTVVVWGGTGKVFKLGSNSALLDGFFASVGKAVGGGDVTGRTDADPGPVGGKAQCAKTSGTGLSMTICAWSGGGGLLGFMSPGTAVDKAGERMRSMLAAIVVKN
jgi:hypothetical protein